MFTPQKPHTNYIFYPYYGEKTIISVFQQADSNSLRTLVKNSKTIRLTLSAKLLRFRI